MKYMVEVAHLVNGDLVSFRRLSARRERLGAWVAVACVVISSLGAMALGATLVRALGRGIYAPWFVTVWATTLLATTFLAVSLVRRRLRRYVLGSRLEADAFASQEVDLVRRLGNRFELTLVPGMKGYIESGRAPLPVEALVRDRNRTITLEDGATAQLSLGTSTFVVRSRVVGAAKSVGWGQTQATTAAVPVSAAAASATMASEGSLLSRDIFKLFSRAAVAGVQLAFVGTLFCAVPTGQTIGDRAAHLVAPRITTPWEAEKWLRIEAQVQSRSLHQCFDPLPLSCQHPGYVGVGVSLTRDGEVRSNWIARSTFGQDCPVDECVRNVVSTWVFDPLPESMRVVLPVQVLRTDRPLPTKVAEVDVGAGQIDWRGSAAVQWQREH